MIVLFRGGGKHQGSQVMEIQIYTVLKDRVRLYRFL